MNDQEKWKCLKNKLKLLVDHATNAFNAAQKTNNREAMTTYAIQTSTYLAILHIMDELN